MSKKVISALLAIMMLFTSSYFVLALDADAIPPEGPDYNRLYRLIVEDLAGFESQMDEIIALGAEAGDEAGAEAAVEEYRSGAYQTATKEAYALKEAPQVNVGTPEAPIYLDVSKTIEENGKAGLGKYAAAAYLILYGIRTEYASVAGELEALKTEWTKIRTKEQLIDTLKGYVSEIDEVLEALHLFAKNFEAVNVKEQLRTGKNSGEAYRDYADGTMKDINWVIFDYSESDQTVVYEGYIADMKATIEGEIEKLSAEDFESNHPMYNFDNEGKVFAAHIKNIKGYTYTDTEEQTQKTERGWAAIYREINSDYDAAYLNHIIAAIDSVYGKIDRWYADSEVQIDRYAFYMTVILPALNISNDKNAVTDICQKFLQVENGFTLTQIEAFHKAEIATALTALNAAAAAGEEAFADYTTRGPEKNLTLKAFADAMAVLGETMADQYALDPHETFLLFLDEEMALTKTAYEERKTVYTDALTTLSAADLSSAGIFAAAYHEDIKACIQNAIDLLDAYCAACEDAITLDGELKAETYPTDEAYDEMSTDALESLQEKLAGLRTRYQEICGTSWEIAEHFIDADEIAELNRHFNKVQQLINPYLLKDAQDKYLAELKSLFEAYAEEDYIADNWLRMEAVYAAAEGKIKAVTEYVPETEEASTKSVMEAVLAEAQADWNAVETKAEMEAAAKSFYEAVEAFYDEYDQNLTREAILSLTEKYDELTEACKDYIWDTAYYKLYAEVVGMMEESRYEFIPAEETIDYVTPLGTQKMLRIVLNSNLAPSYDDVFVMAVYTYQNDQISSILSIHEEPVLDEMGGPVGTESVIYLAAPGNMQDVLSIELIVFPKAGDAVLLGYTSADLSVFAGA